MPCFLVLLAVILPRVTLAIIWLLTDWLGRAYETALWPILGFFFMPYTTLAYMAAMLKNNHQLSGWWIALLIVAVVADAGSHRATTRRKVLRA